MFSLLAGILFIANSAFALEPPCSDLEALKTKVTLGQLSEDEVECLEKLVSTDDSRRIEGSHLLITQARTEADKSHWEQLVARHLQEVDGADARLNYEYAAYLSRKGPARAEEVIDWATKALANYDESAGKTFHKETAHKIRVLAAMLLWRVAEERHAANPSMDTKLKVEQARERSNEYLHLLEIRDYPDALLDGQRLAMQPDEEEQP